MDRKTSILLLAAITLVIVISIVGALVATELLTNYKVVVDGILGIVTCYLIYRLFISSKGQESNELHPAKLLLFPANISLFIRVFWWTMIINWAFTQTYLAIIYLVQLIGSGTQ